MNSKFVVFIVFLLFSGMMIGNVYAHKAIVYGDYKINVGWQTEPPIVNKKNAIEIVLTIATEYEKQSSVYPSPQTGEKPSKDDLTGLSDKLEAYITLNGEKTFLTITEDPKFPGVYHGEYTPAETGSPNVNLVGTIKNTQFELTFHPEKIEEAPADSAPTNLPTDTVQDVSIPAWIKNNAKWWSEDQIDDKTFASGIQFLLKEKIIQVPISEQGQASGEIAIPAWIKNNAKWWSEDQIDDKTFASGIQFLVKEGIISV
jgi:hypothetical protein